MKRSFKVLIGTGILLTGFQNCSPVNFDTSRAGALSNTGVTANTVQHFYCDLTQLTIPIKILFVVDTSGSNAVATKNTGTNTCGPTDVGCAPATDPNKTFREGSIMDFFNAYQSKTNFSWSIDGFQDTSANSFMTGSSFVFSNASDMQTAIARFNNYTDQNATPYIAGLNAAITTIANDPDLHSTAAHPPLYNVIFISDGYPTDGFDTSDGVIQSLLALAPGRVTLSTVYYGTINDSNAANALYYMSVVGQGQFVNVDTGSTSSIAFDDLINIPNGDCQ